VARLSLLDLTLPLQELQKTLYSLTTSLPIILLNLPRISAALYDLYSSLKDGQDNLHSGVDSTLQLHHALFETCQGEALPYLSETAKHLVRIGSLRALDPRLVERTFSSLSLILRTMSPFLLKSTPEAQKALKETWHEVRPYLRPKTNKKYVRKCIADAFAGVIRKARSEGLSRLVDVLLEDDAEGLEAVWTNSLKGTSHHLHSRALPVITLLLDRLAATSSEAQLTTLNMVMTAMVHHCSSSTMIPVIEAILARVEPSTVSGPSSSKTPVNLSSSKVMLSILSTVLLIRKGKRYPESLLKPTMVKLQNMLPVLGASKETDLAWRKEFVLCVMGSLQAGKLSQWLSPGVALIDGLWALLVSNSRSTWQRSMLISRMSESRSLSSTRSSV
jgi:U3 small nucleolar RNA-associated protein 20